MPPRRKRSRLEPLGAVRAARLGVSAARARRLELAAAWTAVAGEAVAARARAVAIRRGVLELEIADERWARAVAGLLPGLAGRLARDHPALGVRRFRIRGTSGGGTPASRSLPPEAPARPEAVAAGPTADVGLPAEGDGSPATAAERLERAARRCLAARERRRGR